MYVNQVGGQDELVFDGASFVLGADRGLRVQAPSFVERLTPTRWHRNGQGGWNCAPGEIAPELADEEAIYAGYRGSYFHSGDETEGEGAEAAPQKEAKPDGQKAGNGDTTKAAPKLSWANLYKVMIARYLKGEFAEVQQRYVFDTRPLTNERPYFAGYIKVLDIPKFLHQLDAVSDEWGYLLLWATLILALIFGYRAMKEIDRSNGTQTGRGLAVAGVVLGWVGLVMGVIWLILFFTVFLPNWQQLHFDFNR